MPSGYKLNLSEQQINDILKLHNDGLKDREIAEIYGIGRTTVGKLLNKHGIYRRPSLDKRVDDVMQLFNQGKNQTEIKDELHMDWKNVRKILKENNVDVTKNSWKHKYKMGIYLIANKHTFDRKQKYVC